MSIDARIEFVKLNPNGSGYLNLIDRPAKDGGTPGIAGQTKLHFKSSPLGIRKLEGQDIWGGSSEIMLGDRKIAERTSYTEIKFVVDMLL